MDEAAVREQAQAHGQAMVDGDMNRAGSDLTKEAMASAGAVMKEMPRPVTAADIQSIEAQDDGYLVAIKYSGPETSIVVRSRWIDEGARPKIAELTLG